MQTRKKKVHFFFSSVCCIVFNCSWQLIMFGKKQKSCVKHIHLVTDDDLYGRKAFYTVKVVFYSSSINTWKIMVKIKNHLKYWHVNNSCEWTMSQKLPLDGFKWVREISISMNIS